MVNEDVASSSISIVKELAPIVTKLVTSFIGMIGIIGKATGKYFIKPAAAFLKERLRGGEIPLKKMLNAKEDLIKADGRIPLHDEEMRKFFTQKCKEFGVEFAVGEGIYADDFDKDGKKDITLYFYAKDEMKVEHIFALCREEFSKRQAVKQTFRENSENIDFSKVHVNVRTMDFTKAKQQSRDWSKTQCYEEAWKETSYEGKDNNIFSKENMDKQFGGNKEAIFLHHLKERITNKLGKDGLDTNLLHIPNESILYFDEKDFLHLINLRNLSYQKIEPDQLNECLKELGSQDILDNYESLSKEELVSELKNNFLRSNKKIKEANIQLETKYKDYGEKEKTYLHQCMLSKELYPQMDISLFDDKKYDVNMMQAINEANLSGLPMDKILGQDFSAQHIHSLIRFEALAQERNGFTMDIKDIFYDNTLNDKQLSQLVEAYENNPVITVDELKQELEAINIEQEKFESMLKGEDIKDKNLNAQDKNATLSDKILSAQAEGLTNNKEILEIQENLSELSDQEYTKKILDAGTSKFQDQSGVWALYNADHKTQYFVNTDVNHRSEVMMLTDVENVKDQYKNWQESYQKAPVAYIDESGAEWRTMKSMDNSNSKLLVNEKGQGKMARAVKVKQTKTVEKTLGRSGNKGADKAGTPLKPKSQMQKG